MVRGARRGDAHGGLYVVDPDAGSWDLAFDWRGQIDFAGRGGDRGLRGIAVVGDRTYLAASDEIFELSPDLKIVASYRCDALRHAHEITHLDGWLFVTSTGYDSLLALELSSGLFRWGLCIRGLGTDLEVGPFDPQRTAPAPGDSIHLNQVVADQGALWLSGRRCPLWLRATAAGDLEVAAEIPLGTHNVQPHRGGVLFNDTDADCVAWRRADGTEVRIPVPRRPPTELHGLHPDNGPLARQGFARGLCVASDGRVFGGVSPSTVVEYDLDAEQVVATVCGSGDVRHAIHGLTEA